MNPTLAIAMSFALLSACSIGPITEQQFLHSLTVQPNGNPEPLEVVPGPAGITVGPNFSFAEQLRCMLASEPWRRKQRVLVFVHGGLNTLSDGLARTAKLAPAIQFDTGGATYPIFVNWRSDLETGYTDHLTRYHNGELGSSFWRWLGTPFVLVADLGRALARSPIVYGDQAYAALSRVFSPATGVDVPESWRDRVCLDPRPPQWSTMVRFVDTVTQGIPGGLRLLTTPLIDTIGFEGYDMLQRRVDTLFFTNDDLREQRAPHGALYELMAHIPVGTPIVLVGHSMGTIAANEVVRRFPQHHFTDIVYLAAACTVKDFMDAVPAYIADGLARGRTTNWWNLCLHPAADEREVTALSIVPNGSLLEWLDTYVLGPRTRLHRTLGKWNNAVPMLPLLDGLDPRVQTALHMKGFTVRDEDFPREHGSFDEFCFWRREFWDPQHFDPVPRVEQLGYPRP